MKRSILLCLVGIFVLVLPGCKDHHAAQSLIKGMQANPPAAAEKTGAPFVGVIENKDYTFKLHRAFVYEPKLIPVTEATKPKAGCKFVCLDVSLANTGAKKLEGGFLFVDLRVTGENGTEYKKPAAALAAYLSENAQAGEEAEYRALWESFTPGAFHRAVVYAVEVPETEKKLRLELPADNKKQEWTAMSFSL